MNSPTDFFSEKQKALALEIKRRILSGENIPLTDLLSLLQKGAAESRKIIKEENKPTDVDYF